MLGPLPGRVLRQSSSSAQLSSRQPSVPSSTPEARAVRRAVAFQRRTLVGCATDTRGTVHSGHVFAPDVTTTPIAHGQLVKTFAYSASCHCCPQPIAAIIVAHCVTQIYGRSYLSSSYPCLLASVLRSCCVRLTCFTYPRHQNGSPPVHQDTTPDLTSILFISTVHVTICLYAITLLTRNVLLGDPSVQPSRIRPRASA